MAWSFVVFGEKFREAQLTLDQAMRVEDLLEKRWGEIHPGRSAKAALYLSAVMYADRAGIDVKDAIAKVKEITVPSFCEEVDLNDSDDLPGSYENGFPPTADESSTPT
jgi:hypothetical protein